jgi:ribosomal protein L11 methyltransferase
VTWKVSLPCTRAEAEGITDELPELAALEPPPVLMTSEPDPDRPDEWRLDAYFETEPDGRAVMLLRALVPSAAPAQAEIERIEPQDWVTLSQQGWSRSGPAASSCTPRAPRPCATGRDRAGDRCGARLRHRPA